MTVQVLPYLPKAIVGHQIIGSFLVFFFNSTWTQKHDHSVQGISKKKAIMFMS